MGLRACNDNNNNNSGTPRYDHLINTTTLLLRPLFCTPNINY